MTGLIGAGTVPTQLLLVFQERFGKGSLLFRVLCKGVLFERACSGTVSSFTPLKGSGALLLLSGLVGYSASSTGGRLAGRMTS